MSKLYNNTWSLAKYIIKQNKLFSTWLWAPIALTGLMVVNGSNSFKLKPLIAVYLNMSRTLLIPLLYNFWTRRDR